MKQRLDRALVSRGLVTTRSQAESYIRLGKVSVNKKIITKSGHMASETDDLKLLAKEQYVSRAALKLASVAKVLKLDFRDKVVLDVGSSTGGFTDFALQHGAKKVIAVDVGTNQLHPSLHGDARIELHEKTDIRNVRLQRTAVSSKRQAASRETHTAYRVLLTAVPDIVLIDLSFISLRSILLHIAQLCGQGTQVVAMVKPQFEVYAAFDSEVAQARRERSRSTDTNRHPSTSSGFRASRALNKGVIKNDAMRRQILRDFEAWVKGLFVIVDKADSEVRGSKGNTERFYLLHKKDSIL